jgi:hypothetical protein
MKNKARILGLITAIIVCWSVIARVNHLPTAGFGLVLSLGLLFPIYLIINIVSLIKDNKYDNSIIYLGIFFLIYSIGFLFTMMYWPLGWIIYRFGFAFVIISLFVTYFINNSKIVEDKKLSIIFLVFSIIVISLIYAASYRGVPRNIIDGFEIANKNAITSKEILIQQRDFYVTRLDSTSQTIKEIDNKAMQTIDVIENIKKKLALTANDNKEIENYNQIKDKGSFDITNLIMLKQDEGAKLKTAIDNFREYLVSMKLDESIKMKILRLLNTEPRHIEFGFQTWQEANFRNFPVISAIATLTSIQVNILASELIAIQKK